MTVKKGKGREISATESSGTEICSKTIDIDSISEVTETNYSVGQIEYPNNNNESVNNFIVSAYSFNEK